MNSHKMFLIIMKSLATAAYFLMHYLFIPVGALSGAFTGLILYAIWSPFFSIEEKRGS